MSIKLTNYISIILAAVIITACGTSNVSIPVIKPAQVDMSHIDQIAVGNVMREHGGFDGYTEERLLSELVKTNYFDVIEINRFGSLLGEFGITLDRILNGNKILPRENFPSTAVISGFVLSEETESERDVIKVYKDKDSVEHTKYKRTIEAKVAINFKIKDLTNNRILYSDDLYETEKFTERYTDHPDKDVNKFDVIAVAKEKIIDRFIKMIVPHREYVSVPFKTEDDIFDRGIEYAEEGVLDMAAEYFYEKTKTLDNYEILSEAYYNLGLCNMYMFNYDEAISNFKEAERLYHCDDYLEAITECRNFEMEQRRVAKQYRE